MKKFLKNKYKQFIQKNIGMGQAFKGEVKSENLEQTTQDKYELLKQKIHKRAESIEDENLAREKKEEDIIKAAKSNIQGLQLRQRLEELVAWVNSEFDELEKVNTQYVISGTQNTHKGFFYKGYVDEYVGYSEKYYLDEKHNLHPDSKFETIQILLEVRGYMSDKIKVTTSAYLQNTPPNRKNTEKKIFHDTWDDIYLDEVFIDEVFAYLEDCFVNVIANIKVNENKSN